MKINDPKLRVLKANNNAKLKDLNIFELCPNLKELYLSECHHIQALEGRDSDLNFPQLEILHIDKCYNLTRLKIHAPKLRVLKTNNNVKLKELHLSECHRIQDLEDTNGKNLKFPQLEILHIDRCNNLERLKIHAPKLQVLKANNDVKLKDLNIAESCSNLKELYLTGCDQLQALEYENGKNLNFPQLEVLHIDKCNNLERLKINASKLRVLKTNYNFKLKEIHLSECYQIEAVEDESGDNLNFQQLEVLHIDKCVNLERLKINAPKLQVLKANYNFKLKDLKISELCQDLKKLYLSEYRQIQALEGENGKYLNFSQLEVLHIDECNNLERLKINAPKLQVLKANNDVKLKDLNMSESCSDLKELYLSECHQVKALEDRDRKYLNFQRLEVLHIDKCVNLERLKINAPKLQVLKANNDVKLKDLNMSESCSDLKELYLSECHQVKALEDRDRKYLNFQRLEVLHIDKCVNLERLKINAPKLQVLNASNGVKLKELNIFELCLNLKELYLSECHQIQALEDRDKDLNFPQLEVLHIDGCNNLARLKINAPKLRALKTNYNFKLKEIHLSECYQIEAVEDENGDSLNFQQLEVLNIDRCNNLARLKINAPKLQVLKTNYNFKLKEIHLSECYQIEAVEDENGDNLNFPQLEVLYIDECNNLERLKINASKLQILKANNNAKLKDINIVESCSNLKKLYLSRCHQIEAVEDENGDNLNFPQLEVLHIDECNNLERLKINAPKLQILKANNNAKLKDINIVESCSNLKKLYLSGCHQIEAVDDEKGDNLNFPQLEVLHIDECNNLERLKINAPKLQILKANNNAKLKDINITESCSDLKELYLSGCHQIQALEGENGKNLNFPQLEVLHIDRCGSLEILKIYATNLRILKADNNAKLKEIDAVTFPLIDLIDLINIDNCPLLTKTIFRNKVFGKKDWEKYFGDIGEEPPLPYSIEDILNEPCSFWPDRKVKETHLLVLIPNTVNGKPFTINYLQKLIQEPKSGFATTYDYYRYAISKPLEHKSYRSHWALMTNDIIPRSRNAFRQWNWFIADHSAKTGIPCKLPHELDVATCILTYYVRTGERLYSCTTTCTKDVDERGSRLSVGYFSNKGLCFDNYEYYGESGVAEFRVLRGDSFNMWRGYGVQIVEPTIGIFGY